MKKIIYILLFFLNPLMLFAQDKSPDIKKEQNIRNQLQDKSTKEREITLREADDEKSASQDSTKQDDSRGRMHKMRKRMMDSFMDKDGDGINDCRARGMRWSGGKGNGEGYGKGKQKGLGRHGK